jgi:hypothetical protein
MADIIQQLLDLKEWSQDSARYERRLNFRGGQLVQPGPGRQPFAPENIVRVAGPEVYKITGTSSRDSPVRDAILEAYKKFKNTFKKVPSIEEIWKYQSVKKVLGKTSAPFDYIGHVLRKGDLPFKFEIESGKSETLRKHLRTLKNGTMIDTTKVVDKFKLDSIGNLRKILNEPEFKNKKFDIVLTKREKWVSSITGQQKKPISPAEMKMLLGILEEF